MQRNYRSSSSRTTLDRTSEQATGAFIHVRARYLLLTTFIAFSTLAQSQTFKSFVFASGSAQDAQNPQAVDEYQGPTERYIWVAYGNSAATDGSSGFSLIVAYNHDGQRQIGQSNTSDIVCIRSGLNHVWTVENPGGNSNLFVIEPDFKVLYFGETAMTRGYASIAFLNNSAFLSYTNPLSATDPTLQKISPLGVLPMPVVPILTMGATGTNLATGQTDQPTSQHSPHSLRATPEGNLMMGSSTDGQLIFVSNPGSASQSVSFLNVVDPQGVNASSLLDATYVTAIYGTFFVTDTGNNQVIAIPATGLTPNSLFALLGSSGELVQVDQATGTYKVVMGGFNDPQSMVFVPNRLYSSGGSHSEAE
jgi:hypothetical protein